MLKIDFTKDWKAQGEAMPGTKLGLASERLIFEVAHAKELGVPCRVARPNGLRPVIAPFASNSRVPLGDGKRLIVPVSSILPENAVDLMVGTVMESEVAKDSTVVSAILIQGCVFEALEEPPLKEKRFWLLSQAWRVFTGVLLVGITTPWR